MNNWIELYRLPTYVNLNLTEFEMVMNWVAILNELEFFFQLYFHNSKITGYIYVSQ